MRKLILSSCLLLLSACGTLRAEPDTQPTKETVCNPIVSPVEEKLVPFTFFALPAATMAEGGVELKAGLSSDGVIAVLGNLSKLQKREQQWQGRAIAANECLAEEAKQRAERAKKNK